MNKRFFVGLVCASVLCVTSSAMALDFDFNGMFSADNDVVLLDFTVGIDSTVTIFSSSWDDGGFDPILAVWDSSGNLVNEQDDGGLVGSAPSNGVSYDYGNWDSYYSVILAAGNYTASIAQYDNFANGSNLTDGFLYDANPNFTFDNGYGSQEFFNGVYSANTGDWAFHILNVAEASNQTPVPEPATMLLFGTGLVGLIGLRKRKSKK